MVDVTIRGAGIFGLSIAWSCVQRGARVRVVDPNGPAAGASGGVVGALAPHVPENWNAKKAFQLDSLLMAQDFWDGVELAGKTPSDYGRLGRLQPIADDRGLSLAHQRAETAQALWQDAATWQVRDAAGLGDWCPPSPTGYVIHDTLSARIHPRQACLALVAALRAKGVECVETAADQGAVVHATGVAGLLELNQTFDKPIGNGVKGQAAILRYDAGPVPQIFADALHFIPHADGTLAIGSTSERDYVDPHSTDALLDDLLIRARTAMPMLQRAEVVGRWAGLRPRSKSRAPLLGHYPSRPGHFVANGGFKIGFGMAPKIADVMARLVLENDDQIPSDFKPQASGCPQT